MPTKMTTLDVVTPIHEESFVALAVNEPNSQAVPHAKNSIAGASHKPG